MRTQWVQVLQDESSAADRAAHLVAGRLRRAVEAQGYFRLALGGATCAATIAVLAAMDLPFAVVEIFEAAAQHPPVAGRSNHAAILVAAGAQLRAMPVDADDLSVAASAYQRTLSPRLDLVHLTVADGDPASLCLFDDPLHELDGADVGVARLPDGETRMVLTWRGIAAASEVLWVALGAAGARHVARLVSAEPTSSLGKLMAGNVRIIVDGAAAAELEERSVRGVSFWHRDSEAIGEPSSRRAGVAARSVNGKVT